MEHAKRKLLRDHLRNFCVFVLFLLINQTSGQVLFEGDKCRIDESTFGMCIKLPNCRSLQQTSLLTLDLKKLVTCSYDKFTPIVCCPITDEHLSPPSTTPRSADDNPNDPNRELWEKAAVFPTVNNSAEQQALERKCASPRLDVTSGRKAEAACIEYEKEYNPTIIYHIPQGKLADRGRFSYMVGIGSWDESKQSIKWLCGGALITDRWIVTAAHCVNDTGKYIVRMGTSDLNIVSSDEIALSVQKVIFHPDYNPAEYYDDIALLQLNATVKYNEYIYPICLQTNQKEVPQDFVYATAVWSKIRRKEPEIHTYDVTLVDNNVCDVAHTLSDYGFIVNETRIPQGMQEGQLCGQDENNFTEHEKGGILEYSNKDGFPALHGLVSFGVQRSTPKSRVFTKISHYVKWIECIVWP